jgi:monoterpene epsilon-lactone hydrolase
MSPSTEIFHSLDNKDAGIVETMRQALAPIKGTINSPASRGLFDEVMEHTPDAPGIIYEPGAVGGVSGIWCLPADKQPDTFILYCHGGAYVLGSAHAFRHLAGQIAARTRSATFVPDYRLAPEHPFPAAVTDLVAVYRGLCGLAPKSIAIAGDSAGGGLALVLLALMQAEAVSGQVLAPIAGVAMSPWTDLALTGTSMTERAEADPLLTQDMLSRTAALYLNGQPADMAMTSPLYGNLANLPPVHIHVGEDEVLLDDARRYAHRSKAAGSNVSLNVWQGMAHVFPANVGTLAASEKALDLIGEFLTASFDR